MIEIVQHCTPHELVLLPSGSACYASFYYASCPEGLDGHAENFNWCTVPKHGQDAVLFAGVALLTACLFSGQFFALAVLLAGAQARCFLQREQYCRPCCCGLPQVSPTRCAQLQVSAARMICSTLCAGGAVQALAFPVNFGPWGNALVRQ